MRNMLRLERRNVDRGYLDDLLFFFGIDLISSSKPECGLLALADSVTVFTCSVSTNRAGSSTKAVRHVLLTFTSFLCQIFLNRSR